MGNGIRVPDPVLWSEGMLLTPQHFQQNDIYWHALLAHQMSQLQPHYWGILDLALDEAALRAGKVCIRRLHAVMPDGLVVQYPSGDPQEPLQIDVSAEPSLRENRPMAVYLTVPVRVKGAASRTSSIQRFDSVRGELEVDENTGEADVEVPRLRAKLGLYAGDKVPAKYVAMPLLQIRRDIGGHFELTDYHPPMLRLSASRFLGNTAIIAQLEALATRIRAKAKELLGIVDDETPTATNGHQNDIVRRLVAALPPFEIMVRTESTHPFFAYLALANVVGQMAGMAGDPLPMLPDAYRHDHAAPGFLKAVRHLTGVLTKLNAAYEATAFTRGGDNLYVCALAAGLRADRLVIELKPGSGQTVQSLTQWINGATIGTETMMPLLRRRRLPGARVRPLSPDQMMALGISAGALFEIVNQAIEQDEKLVPVVQPGAALHIEGPAAAQGPAAIVLYTANRPSKRHEMPSRAVVNG